MAEQLGSNYYNSPYKFNGKELDEETGLYYYGARYYDPRISIFQSADPLFEKAPNWTPYRYCFNNPVKYVDPTGLFEGPGDEFSSPDEAAKDFAMKYNGTSIINDVELRSYIYEVKNKNEHYFSYTVPTGVLQYDQNGDRMAGSAGNPDPDLLPKGAKIVADIHSHGPDRAGRGRPSATDNKFSSGDLDNAWGWNGSEYVKENRRTSYVVTPNGNLFVYDVDSKDLNRKGSNNIGGKGIPSDPLSPTRTNEISPNVCPNIDPIIYDTNNIRQIIYSKFNPERKFHKNPDKERF